MTIDRVVEAWASWIEFDGDNVDFDNPLDIRQIPALVDRFAKKFFKNGMEMPLYRGFFRIVQDYLPAPDLGMGFENREKESRPDPYVSSFTHRVEYIPFKDGDVVMSAQAFRLALIGSKAFERSGVYEKSLFYRLGFSQRKYILEKQPGLFPLRTELLKKIGNSPLREILEKSSPSDLLIDAAIFGSEALTEVLPILKDSLPELCRENAKILNEIVPFYNGDSTKCLAYELVMHQLKLGERRQFYSRHNDYLMHFLNTHCSAPDADKSYTSLVYPNQPLQRAFAIFDWVRAYRKRVLHIPCSEITNILLAKHLDLAQSDLNPVALLDEFDSLDAEEKKTFIAEIVLEKFIEALEGQNKRVFLEELEKRGGSLFYPFLKLALFAISFNSTDEDGKKNLPRLSTADIYDGMQALLEEDKKWFIDHFLLHRGVLSVYLQDQSIYSFFDIIPILRSGLAENFFKPKLFLLQEKILEICPIENIPYALNQLELGNNLFSCLANYLLEKLRVNRFDRKAFAICEKFFSHEKNGLEFICSIALIEVYQNTYLIHAPNFQNTIPLKYRRDIEILSALIEPFSTKSNDYLKDKLQSIPVWLKVFLMGSIPFTTNFEKVVLAHLNQLYMEGFIPPNEMFFFATRLPYSTFLKLAQECSYEGTASHVMVPFNGRQDTIFNHIRDMSLAIPRDPYYSAQDLGKFLNRCPQTVIGEGRWIQFLARELFSYDVNIVKYVVGLMPEDLIPYVLEFSDQKDKGWFLRTRYEVIFTKNIDKFSTGVQKMLIDNLEEWFPFETTVLESIHSLWEMQRKSLKEKLELFDETQTQLNLFRKRCREVEALRAKLNGTECFAKMDSIAREFSAVEAKIAPLVERMNAIDLTPISDLISQQLLEGEVYSYNGQVGILRATRDQLKENPFTREELNTEQEKEQALPPITPEQAAELDKSRTKIDEELDSFRDLVLQTQQSEKRPAH
ncbi:MAG: hypothetical protein EB053_04765 [Chlamydiae bacterium]|nr:hypothetical protein [Chlamydiota bacterium]